MDPVGPWSYAYNRIATVQPSTGTSSSGDFHHHLATIAAATAHNASIGGISVPSSGSTSSSSPGSSVQRSDFSVHPATSQLLLQSGFSASNFLSSPSQPPTSANLAYETVFPAFLSHAAPPNPKPAHYNNIQAHRHRTDSYQQSPQQQHLTIVSQQPQSSRTRFVCIFAIFFLT